MFFNLSRYEWEWQWQSCLNQANIMCALYTHFVCELKRIALMGFLRQLP